MQDLSCRDGKLFPGDEIPTAGGAVGAGLAAGPGELSEPG